MANGEWRMANGCDSTAAIHAHRGGADDRRRPRPNGARLLSLPDLEEAKRLGNALLDARLAGCINILPGMVSLYNWKGAREESEEAVLIAKTTPAAAPQAREFLEREHPYDVPAILTLPLADVNSGLSRLAAAAGSAETRTARSVTCCDIEASHGRGFLITSPYKDRWAAFGKPGEGRPRPGLTLPPTDRGALVKSSAKPFEGPAEWTMGGSRSRGER